MSTKTAAATGAAAWLTPLLLVGKQYLFADPQFLIFLFILVALDTVSGLIVAWRAHAVSSRRFGGVFTKSLVYVALLVLTHVLTHFTVGGKVNMLFQWFDSFAYSAMMAREALSILENLAKLQPGLVPKWVTKRLAAVLDDEPTSPAAPVATDSTSDPA